MRAILPAMGLLRHSVVPLLLVACASTPEQSRVVLIESDSYVCGAAEGLGCGLALAPVLGQIDDLDGVAESSVSWDGRTFRIEILPGADPNRVSAAATALLEGDACCVTAPWGLAERGEPDTWFNAEQTAALSRHEAAVIAAGLMSEIAEQGFLEQAVKERLHAVLREELEKAFERAHAAGGGIHRLRERLPESRASIESRLAFLTPDQRVRVLAFLDRKLEEGG